MYAAVLAYGWSRSLYFLVYVLIVNLVILNMLVGMIVTIAGTCDM